MIVATTPLLRVSDLKVSFELPPKDAPLLEVDNLQVEFRTREGIARAVNGVSYNVRAGETLAVLGESGSGKSVTALSVLRLIPNPPGRIENGEILFDGTDLLKLDDPGIRAVRGNKIAMIFQDPLASLNPVYTIGDQIAEAMLAHNRVGKQAAEARALEFSQ